MTISSEVATPTEIFDLAMDKGLSQVAEAFGDRDTSKPGEAVNLAGEELARLCGKGHFDQLGGKDYLERVYRETVGRIEDARDGSENQADFEKAFILATAIRKISEGDKSEI